MSEVFERYGSRPRPRWLWPLIAAIGIAIGIGWAAWAGFQEKPVSAQLYGYEVVNDHLVEVKIDVHRPKPVAVRCTVYAQAHDHGIVGEKTVDLPAIDAKDQRVEIAVETERRAVNGVLRTCQTRD